MGFGGWKKRSILYPWMFEICVKFVQFSLADWDMLSCLSLAFTGNVLKTGTFYSTYGGSHNSLSDQGKRGKEGSQVRKTESWGREREVAPLLAFFFSHPAQWVGVWLRDLRKRSPSLGLSFLIPQMNISPVVWELRSYMWKLLLNASSPHCYCFPPFSLPPSQA